MKLQARTNCDRSLKGNPNQVKRSVGHDVVERMTTETGATDPCFDQLHNEHLDCWLPDAVVGQLVHVVDDRLGDLFNPTLLVLILLNDDVRHTHLLNINERQHFHLGIFTRGRKAKLAYFIPLRKYKCKDKPIHQ